MVRPMPSFCSISILLKKLVQGSISNKMLTTGYSKQLGPILSSRICLKLIYDFGATRAKLMIVITIKPALTGD